MKKISEKGFTLIELLIVIGIIAILAGAVIVAISPGQQFEQARNATRERHMGTIRTGVMSYAAENDGNFPVCIPDECSGTIDGCTGAGEDIPATNDWAEADSATINDCWSGVLDNYINQEPEDPQQDGGTPTYWLRIAEGGNLQVISTAEEWLAGSDHALHE